MFTRASRAADPRRRIFRLSHLARRLVVGAVPIAVFISLGARETFASIGRPVRIEQLLDRYRQAHVDVGLELLDGEQLNGTILRLNKSEVSLFEQTMSVERGVPFRNIRTLIDSVSGERFQVQQTPGGGQMTGPRPSWRFWVILGVTTTVVIIIARIATSGNF